MPTTTRIPRFDPTWVELYFHARSRQSRQLARSLASVIARTVALAARIREGWQRSRRQRAAYHALSRLDSRTLRDLGFDRSEILSVAAEIAGSADSTRVLLRGPDTARR